MSDHTEGKWEVNGPDDEPYGDITVDSKRRTICRLRQDDAPVEDYNAEQWANARLISAAPDLLLACEELLEVVDPTFHGAETVLRIAKAAIAKAEGKEIDR